MSKLSLGLAVALVALPLTACNKEAPPSAEEPRTPASTRPAEKGVDPAPTVAATGEAPPTAAAPPAAKFDEESFTLTLTPTAPLAAGKKGELKLVLTAKKPYHVNDKYPYKLEFKDADGVSYEANPVAKEKFTVATMDVTGAVGVTVASAGKKTLSGVFKFSVCTEDKCLMEKRELSLDVDVK